MDNAKVIGQRINAALAKSGKRQKDLAAELGVKDNVVSYYCSGTRTPNVKQIIEISRLLRVSTDWLLGLSTFNQYENRYLRADRLGLSEDATLQLLGLKNKQFKGTHGKAISYIDKVNALLENSELESLIAHIAFVESAKRSQMVERIKQRIEYEEDPEECRLDISDVDCWDVRSRRYAAVEDFSKIIDNITLVKEEDLLNEEESENGKHS